jgi:uncharacterized membrane protein YeaQ/YmgE (transglycosylase-associated protein family)
MPAPVPRPFCLQWRPAFSFILVLLIGVVAGLIVHRFVGASWLAQQIAGSTRGYVTSALVGIAGSFVGFHLAGLVKLSTGFVPLVAAAVAALMIVWWWRTLKL